MELSPPLRWLGAIAIMVIVVLITVPMLINTLGETVQLSTGESESAASEFGAVSEAPSDAGEDGDDDGGGNGDDEFPQEYTVEEGDTGAEIAERFYGDPDGWDVIAEANDIEPDDPLRPGEELEIPAPPGDDDDE